MMDLTQKQWVKHSVFHPFEGFEDLRWKKGGSVFYASIVVLLWFIAEILHDNVLGYQFAVTNTKMFSIVPYIVQTIALFLVWVVGNWSICTLLEGEGTMKNIYIYSAYSLIPYVAGLYIRTILSHVLIQDEVIFITCVNVIGLVWSILLMFNAIKAVHQYSISKTILALILTFVAMIIILILLVLLVALFQQVYVFISSVYTEITYRVRV
ncbi:Yip1 family protein [Ruminococcus sp.]|uniref:Yip1 family protein n=1 Tax=Ruminococcus sp. TaxID=41978 RepID=UPI0025EC7287|nr:Yip1 family protein [Ruminococcus sp.]